MAVELEPEAFMYPQGELQPGLFPDGKLEDHLETWIADAATKVTENSPAIKWVYYRAYSAVAQRLANTPSSDTFDHHQNQRVKSWGKDRIEFFERKAAEYKAAFDHETDTPPGSAFGGLGVFRTVGACRRW